MAELGHSNTQRGIAVILVGGVQDIRPVLWVGEAKAHV